MKTKTKILWFSRHTMSEPQLEALTSRLGEVEITQVSGSPANLFTPFDGEIDGIPSKISSMKELCQDFEVLAVVAPIGLQQQFLNIAGDKPVIIAESKRELVKVPGEEDKTIFIFNGWKRLLKIEVLIKDF